MSSPSASHFDALDAAQQPQHDDIATAAADASASAHAPADVNIDSDNTSNNGDAAIPETLPPPHVSPSNANAETEAAAAAAAAATAAAASPIPEKLPAAEAAATASEDAGSSDAAAKTEPPAVTEAVPAAAAAAQSESDDVPASVRLSVSPPVAAESAIAESENNGAKSATPVAAASAPIPVSIAVESADADAETRSTEEAAVAATPFEFTFTDGTDGADSDSAAHGHAHAHAHAHSHLAPVSPKKAVKHTPRRSLSPRHSSQTSNSSVPLEAETDAVAEAAAVNADDIPQPATAEEMESVVCADIFAKDDNHDNGDNNTADDKTAAPSAVPEAFAEDTAKPKTEAAAPEPDSAVVTESVVVVAAAEPEPEAELESEPIPSSKAHGKAKAGRPSTAAAASRPSINRTPSTSSNNPKDAADGSGSNAHSRASSRRPSINSATVAVPPTVSAVPTPSKRVSLAASATSSGSYNNVSMGPPPSMTRPQSARLSTMGHGNAPSLSRTMTAGGSGGGRGAGVPPPPPPAPEDCGISPSVRGRLSAMKKPVGNNPYATFVPRGPPRPHTARQSSSASSASGGGGGRTLSPGPASADRTAMVFASTVGRSGVVSYNPHPRAENTGNGGFGQSRLDGPSRSRLPNTVAGDKNTPGPGRYMPKDAWVKPPVSSVGTMGRVTVRSAQEPAYNVGPGQYNITPILDLELARSRGFSFTKRGPTMIDEAAMRAAETPSAVHYDPQIPEPRVRRKMRY